MKKAELVGKVVEKGNMSHKDAERAIELVLDTLKATMQNGDTVSIRGFGTFGVKSVAARECRNPQTGEKITVPAKKRPFWKPAKEFLDN